VLALATLKQVMEEKARPATARRCLLPRAGGASGPDEPPRVRRR